MSRHQIPNRLTTLAFALPVALLAAAGCGRTINMDGVKKAVSDGLHQQVGLEIASVACPAESRPAKAGDTFECTATPKAGGSITVQITQKDDQGNINWEVAKSQGLLDMTKVEAAVQKGLAEQQNAEATVSCGERFQVAHAGDTLECEATGADGETSTVTVTVKDDSGNISWKVE